MSLTTYVAIESLPVLAVLAAVLFARLYLGRGRFASIRWMVRCSLVCFFEHVVSEFREVRFERKMRSRLEELDSDIVF